MPADGNTWSAAGVATFDCNDDGFPDMLLAGGEAPAKFYRNTSTRGGALHFEAEQSGLELDGVTGAYPLDIDSDGITDLVLLRVGETVVDARPRRLQVRARQRTLGLQRRRRLVDVVCGDLGARRGVADAGDRQLHRSQAGDRSLGVVHRQLAASSQGRRRQEPSRSSRRPLPLKPSYCALSMLFTDWNRSGTPSLRISNDREYYRGGQEQLWHIDPGKPPALYTDADGWKSLKIWGMGIASYDVTGDGYPDYFLTSMADNKLQTFVNAPGDGHPRPEYKDVAFPQERHRAAPLHRRRRSAEHGLARRVRGREQ